MHLTLALVVSAQLLSCAARSPEDTASPLPVVDVGYSLYEATEYNATGRYYNFSDIRYAAPPLGELRFAKPEPPVVNRTSVQKGGEGYMCPQALPAWLSTSHDFIPRYLAGQTQFNGSWETPTNLSGVYSPNPDQSEDCLFLDVVVPKAIFDRAGKGYGAPVLVWIYGGGFVKGAKNYWGNAAGLVHSSQHGGNDGIVYVALNYRLGAFGWLGGPSLRRNGTANVGLHDQRLALEWVKTNIAKFGGDPARVTVMGESAGASSILHQITAYGGNKGPVPFAQAIPQSPALQPIVSNRQQESILKDFLRLANVSTIQEARGLSSEDLQRANAIQVHTSSYSAFTFGPALDSDFVPALPQQLLGRGQYDTSINVLVGYNADEGLLFISPYLRDEATTESYYFDIYPTLNGTQETVNQIFDVMYPAVYNGTQATRYTNPIGRAKFILSEMAISCNANALDKAFKNAYAYLFAVPPAIHGLDVPYTFYNGDDSSVNATIAKTLQRYIVNFAEKGSPNSADVPLFPAYGTNSSIQVLNVTGLTQDVDESDNPRCSWWQEALFY